MRLGGVAVEQILSGTLGSPQDYDQAHDEWVVVLEGGAVLEVEGERLDLAAGDWVLLRAPCRTGWWRRWRERAGSRSTPPPPPMSRRREDVPPRRV